MLQMQKEFFYLWRSSSKIKPLIRFIAHYKGPYSEALKDTITNPVYLQDLWDFVPPKNNDDLSGGIIKLNKDGIKKFSEYLNLIKSKNNLDLIQLLAAMRLLHDLYDELSPKELLYMIYINPNNKDFIKHSEVYDTVMKSNIKDKLSEKINFEKINYDFL